jgi:fused signal recognition particle receptor
MVLKFIQSSYGKLKESFASSGSLLGSRLRKLFSQKIDEESLDNLEQILYEADLGVKVSSKLIDSCKTLLKSQADCSSEALIKHMKSEIHKLLIESDFEKILEKSPKPCVFLVVGVNGSGKTTSIAKLSYHLKKEGRKVLLGAADTFRAAASSQLEKWAKISKCELVKSSHGADPASVAYDSIEAALSRSMDVVFIDTAGRLHNKVDLMQELTKIKKVSEKLIASEQLHTLLVLDAHTGQNSASQVKNFQKSLNLSGVILSKMDGSAKGGSLVAISQELELPIYFLGTGEGLEDIQAFDKTAFVDALFS